MQRIRNVAMLLCIALLLQAAPAASARGAAPFDDVPSGHWAEGFISELRALGITDGVGDNRFGLGREISRAEFATFMCKVMGWPQAARDPGSFEDNRDPAAWYYGYVEAAAAHGAVPAGGRFRPHDPITRSEMAVMLVRALGYDELAQTLVYLGAPFPDVSSDTGYITVARDLGIISGMSAQQFAPGGTALREHAAAMLVKMLEALDHRPEYYNAFYAISSASQMAAAVRFDSVSFGWSKLVLEDGRQTLRLDSVRAAGNEYGLPQGWEEPYGLASDGERLLMVAVDASAAPLIISCAALHEQAADLLAGAVLGISDAAGGTASFDGLVVDFEGLNGDSIRRLYVDFLGALRTRLDAHGKSMSVAVHPRRREGQFSYSGYDYRAIGELADRVILMAHDYNAKRLTDAEMARGVVTTPLAPLDEVYYALRAITDEDTGVADRRKILLQFSFGTAQWKVRDGAVINEKPYTPSFAAVQERIQAGAALHYSERYQSPYITFSDPDDGTDSTVWYEDARSIEAKTRLALLFGVTGFSAWRLGEIPDGPAAQHLNVLESLSAG